MNPSNNSFWSRALPNTPPPTPPSDEIFHTPNNSIVEIEANNLVDSTDIYSTPTLNTQFSNCSINSDIFGTPDSTLDSDDVFQNVELRKNKNNIVDNKMGTITEHSSEANSFILNTSTRSSLRENKNNNNVPLEGVMRSKSDFEIPVKTKTHGLFQNLQQNILNLSPASRRRLKSTNSCEIGNQSTPNSTKSGIFKIPGSPILNNHSQSCGTRAISLNSLRHSSGEYVQQANMQQKRFVLKMNILLAIRNQMNVASAFVGLSFVAW